MHKRSISLRVLFLILILALTTAPLTSVLALEEPSDAPLEVWVDPAFDCETPGFGDTHFTTINEALSVVDISGTVYVAPGSYHGFEVNKPGVTVLASPGAVVDADNMNSFDTQPQGIHAGILVFAPDVTIKGFTVQNWESYGIYVSYFATRGSEFQPLPSPPENGTSANVTIDGNHLLNNEVGILARGAGNVVRNNVSESNLYAGIIVEGEDCTIENNTVKGSSDFGIGWSGSGFTVVNNNSSENEDGVGLMGEGATHSLVKDNILEDNMAGLAIIGEGNTALNNTIRNNSVVGIYSITSSFSRLKENHVEPKPDENRYTANMITGNGGDPFPAVNQTAAFSTAGFSISGFSEGGAVFAMGENILRRNHIAENIGYGLYVMDWNLVAEIPDEPEYDIVDARLNWWGHTSGPSHPETNPFAQGQKVSDYVEYSPWLLAEPAAPEPLKTLTDYLEAGESLTIADAVSARVVAGEGTVTVGQYDGNPTGKALFGSTGAYVDVYVTSPHDIEELVVYLFYTGTPEDEEDLVLHWWNGSLWVACSESGVNLEDQYVWAVITDESVPALSDLTGTELGAGLVEPADTTPEDPDEREDLPHTGGLGIAGYGLLIMAAGLYLKRKK